jgi:hypothetical protein
LVLELCSEVQTTSFKIVNKCRYTIWPGLLSGATSPPLPTTGFTLKSGNSRTIQIPKAWSGRIWARTLCGQDSEGKFSCITADCGSGKVACAGGGAKPPATLAEFTLNGADGLDFYDVSLVDGKCVRCLTHVSIIELYLYKHGLGMSGVIYLWCPTPTHQHEITLNYFIFSKYCYYWYKGFTFLQI